MKNKSYDDKKIAIVGVSLRLPNADTQLEFWNNLVQTKPCFSKSQRHEKEYIGGFLNDIDMFDSDFFSISPKEAVCIDPQQRILLEVVQNTIDDSALTLKEYQNLNCGVFMTSLPGDYKYLMPKSDAESSSGHSFTGNANSTLAGRISYFYNFNGPSITLDTACSSSITALQEACLHINNDSCQAAIVGGSAIFSTDEIFRMTETSGILAKHSNYTPFDENGSGFVPSEAVCAVTLMKHSEAKRKGLKIYALVEAIGLNHNGRSNGIMAPSTKAQSQLLEKIYTENGIPIADIAYVEAHGTGTRVGDSMEIQSLHKTFSKLKPDYQCLVGASKSVIGHTLVCSGLVSLIKCLLMFKFEKLTPYTEGDKTIDLKGFQVNLNSLPYPENKPLVAISSFGFTGSNGHLVIRKSHQKKAFPDVVSVPRPFLFSAKSILSLQKKLANFKPFLRSISEKDLAGLSFQLSSGIEVYKYRCAVIAKDINQLIDGVQCLWEKTKADQFIPTVIDATESNFDSFELNQWVTSVSDRSLVAIEDRAKYSLLDLPNYPFDRSSYWIDKKIQKVKAIERTPDPITLIQLTSKVSELLGYAADKIDKNKSLLELGFDSITLIEFNEDYKKVLTQEDLYSAKSLIQLAKQIAAHSDLTPQIGPAPAGPKETSADIQFDDADLVLVVDHPNTRLRWMRGKQSGRPILLLPPLNMDHTAWVQQITYFSNLGLQVHIPVYPGHKLNHMSNDPLKFSHILNDIVTYITENFTKYPIDLIGWSFGGCLALEIALKFPKLVKSLVLVSTASEFKETVFEKTVNLQNELVEFKDFFDVVFDYPKNVSEKISSGASLTTLGHYYEMLSSFNVSARLPQLATPTLIIHGEQDSVITRNDVDRLNDINNSTFRFYPDHGHFTPLTHAREVNREILKHINNS